MQSLQNLDIFYLMICFQWTSSSKCYIKAVPYFVEKVSRWDLRADRPFLNSFFFLLRVRISSTLVKWINICWYFFLNNSIWKFLFQHFYLESAVFESLKKKHREDAAFIWPKEHDKCSSNLFPHRPLCYFWTHPGFGMGKVHPISYDCRHLSIAQMLIQ